MNRRGFMFIDLVIALGLLTTVAMLLAEARCGMDRFARQMEDVRAAHRLAERYLIDAAAPAATQPAAARTHDQSQVVATDLPTPAPANWKWVRVRIVVNGRAGEMVGLVRRSP